MGDKTSAKTEFRLPEGKRLWPGRSKNRLHVQKALAGFVLLGRLDHN